MFTQEISRSGAKILDLKYLISLVYLQTMFEFWQQTVNLWEFLNFSC